MAKQSNAARGRCEGELPGASRRSDATRAPAVTPTPATRTRDASTRDEPTRDEPTRDEPTRDEPTRDEHARDEHARDARCAGADALPGASAGAIGERLQPASASDEGESEVRRRRLLSGGTPREILCRIVQGDPLGLRDRAALRLHADAYLLDADRVHLRALARCARFASRCAGRPDLAGWLDEIVEQAIEDLLREDFEPELAREGPPAAPSAAFVALAAPLGLEPDAMQRACTAFNHSPAADRKAFFELVIHARSLDDLARHSAESASEIARRARRALDLLLQAQAAPPESPRPASAEPEPWVHADPAHETPVHETPVRDDPLCNPPTDRDAQHESPAQESAVQAADARARAADAADPRARDARAPEVGSEDRP